MTYIETLQGIKESLELSHKQADELPRFIKWKIKDRVQSALVHINREIRKGE